MNLEDALADGLGRLGLCPPSAAVVALAAYLRLLAQWNRAYNLTAVRTIEDMVAKHVLDSAAVLPWLHGTRVLDVGSGAGLPGIPLAILSPEREYTLLDGLGKRTRFLTQVVLDLKLAHVQVVQARVEDWRPPASFASVISRAFSALPDFVALAGGHCAADGRLLAMKGQIDAAELAGVPAGWHVRGMHRLAVPGVDGERHLLELEPVAAAA